jgi:hypothetical protein
MPITYDSKKKKWCYGDQCIYDSRKKALAASSNDIMKIKLDIVKSLDEDQRLFTCCALRPDVVDYHGDIYDSQTVEKAAYDFMEFCRQGNAFHIVNTDQIVVVESWVAKSTYPFGNGEVKKGDWMMTLHILNDGLWELVKSGDLKGLSVGCKGVVEELTDGS